MRKNSRSGKKSVSEELDPSQNLVISKNACYRRKLTRLRTDQCPNRAAGYYMIEALICCLIIGLITAGLGQGYARIRAFNTHSQTELQAVAICQECIDQLRSQSFTNLYANGLGLHQAMITGTAPLADPVFPRPLLRDTSLTYYQNPTLQLDDSQNFLHCTNNYATVNLTSPDGQTIAVTVTVQWADGTGFHTYQMQSTLCPAGLNG